MTIDKKQIDALVDDLDKMNFGGTPGTQQVIYLTEVNRDLLIDALMLYKEIKHIER